LKNQKPMHGPMYISKGAKMLLEPGLKRYALVPLIINILIYTFAMVLLFHYFGEFVHWIDSHLPHWLQWLNWLIWPLLVLASLVFVAYTFSIVVNIIGAPFNGFLAEKVEQMATGVIQADASSPARMMKDIPRALFREWRKIKYFFPRALALLIVSFIPGINIIAAVLWYLFGSWMMAIEYYDYPMDNHRIPFDDMIAHLRKHYLSSLTFGGCSLLLFVIPVINCFAMPVCVAAATLKWVDERSNHFKKRLVT